jgi:hypothetical protein
VPNSSALERHHLFCSRSLRSVGQPPLDSRLQVVTSALECLDSLDRGPGQTTRIGAGSNGMTIKSSDGKVIDEYLAAKGK